MIIKLPFPAAELFPNRKNGKHWSATAAAKVKARDDGYYVAKQARGAFSDDGGAIPLSLVFLPPDGRRRDLDNMLAAMKASLDGVASALGIDDRRFRPITLDVGFVGAPGAVVVGVGVELTGYDMADVRRTR